LRIEWTRAKISSMGIYSKDLRVRAVEAVERGIPRRDVVETFSISLTTLKRWLRKRREGQDLSSGTSTGRKRRILATEEEERALWAQLETNDDATLERHCELWEEERKGVRVSRSAMSRAIRHKLGWTYKKDAGGHRAGRAQEGRFQGALRRRRDPGRLLFVEESSTNIALTPRYARAPKGERAFGKAPRNWGKNVTLISSITTEGMGPSMSIEGSSDTESFAFGLYMKTVLAPHLRAGQIVLMDNLSVHKAGWVRDLIEDKGCQLWLLPPYSPDMRTP
jgi:transposase